MKYVSTKQILLKQIEVARYRLAWGLSTANVSLISRMSHLLAQLDAQIVDLVKAEEKTMSQTETKYLVFSDRCPDGVIVSKLEYRALTRAMSQDDLRTHTAVEIESGIETELEQAVLFHSEKTKKVS